jgi:hypothetical protein
MFLVVFLVVFLVAFYAVCLASGRRVYVWVGGTDAPMLTARR